MQKRLLGGVPAQGGDLIAPSEQMLEPRVRVQRWLRKPFGLPKTQLRSGKGLPMFYYEKCHLLLQLLS